MKDTKVHRLGGQVPPFPTKEFVWLILYVEFATNPFNICSYGIIIVYRQYYYINPEYEIKAYFFPFASMRKLSSGLETDSRKPVKQLRYVHRQT